METQVITKQNNTSPPKAINFLDLPAELRIKIYKFLLIFSTNVNPMPRHFVSSDGRPKLNHDPTTGRIFSLDCLDICLVSKQLYHETLPIFYRNNRFYFCSLQEQDNISLTRFLAGIGSFRRPLISSIRLDAIVCLNDWNHDSLNYLQNMGMPGTIQICVAQWTSAESHDVEIKLPRPKGPVPWDVFRGWLDSVTDLSKLVLELYWSAPATEMENP